MFSKNKGLAKTNSKELLLNKSGVNSGGKGTEREESMAGKERLMAIRQTIQMQKKASVGELSKICRVTEETIRRDLDKLEADGVVTRVHGGAIWNEGIQKEGVHLSEDEQTSERKAGDCPQNGETFRGKDNDDRGF